MARPKKNTVDYFPHNCKHGKTLYILEQRFEKGYTFFFKLLEALGSSENHFIDLNEDTEIEFLGAKTRLSDTETVEILDFLAKLGAIDKELWAKKVVWSQNFVDGIDEVYKKRNNNVPVKPVLVDGNWVTGSENPQSKVEESKVKESKVNYKDGDTLKLNDGTMAVLRFGSWCDNKPPFTALDRNHYKELP